MNKLTMAIATFVPSIVSTATFARSNADNSFPRQRRLPGRSIFGDPIEEIER
jgi:hypothetical protein